MDGMESKRAEQLNHNWWNQLKCVAVDSINQRKRKQTLFSSLSLFARLSAAEQKRDEEREAYRAALEQLGAAFHSFRSKGGNANQQFIPLAFHEFNDLASFSASFISLTN